jgi:hypothetical protein
VTGRLERDRSHQPGEQPVERAHDFARLAQARDDALSGDDQPGADRHASAMK